MNHVSVPRLQTWLLVVLIAVGLAARLGVAIKIGLNTAPRGGSDASEFDSYAWNLAQGNGFRGVSPDVKTPDGKLLDHPTAYRAPGPSVLWAVVFKVFGHRYGAVRLAHCLLGAATILLVNEIGRKSFSKTVGLLAAGAYSLWPTSLLYSTDLLSEPLYTFLFSCYVLTSLQFATRPSRLSAVTSGILLGLSMLTRPNAVLMIPLAVIWALLQFRKNRTQMVLALLIPIVSVVTLLPWTLRNYAVLHAFVPFSTGGGDVLLGGNNRVVASDPKYYGYWVFPTSFLPEYHEQITTAGNEVKRDRIERRLAAQWLKDNPDKWWYLLHSKLQRSLTPFLQPDSPAIFRWGMLLSWGPLLILAGVAFVPTLLQSLKSGHPAWIIHLAILHFVLTALVFWGSSRFRYPVEGLFLILAMTSVVWMSQRLRMVAKASTLQ